MKLIQCTPRHTEEIRAIFNEVIASSTAIYETEPRSKKVISEWFKTKAANHQPIIGLETAEGKLAGFASYSTFRNRPGYRYTIEHTICVEQSFRAQNHGTRLLRALIDEATAQNYQVMIGAVDAQNRASIALHLQLGFTHCGRLKKVGYKFDRWLDLDFYQLILQNRNEESTHV